MTEKVELEQGSKEEVALKLFEVTRGLTEKEITALLLLYSRCLTAVYNPYAFLKENGEKPQHR